LFDTGARWLGRSANDGGDYVLPIEDLRSSFVSNPLFMYGAAEKLEITDGESLGEIYEPYFNRTPRQFSGHVNTPPKLDPEVHVAGSEKGSFVQYAFPIFSIYQRVGAVAMLEIAENLIRRALATPKVLEVGLPRAGRATLRRQNGREILHLLYANPVLRGHLHGNPVQPIQDLIDLSDVAVSVAVDRPIGGVKSVPEGTNIDFEVKDGRVSFSVPRVRGHQMVEIY
ncbi:hypothetical protein, partial [Roseibium sp.]